MNTSQIDQEKIGDIVARNYHTAGIFQKYGIDFCCGGGVTVQKACQKKGLDISVISDELTRVMATPIESGENYHNWTASLLIDYIEQIHHTFVRNKIEEIGFYSARVAEVHAVTHPENIEIHQLFAELANEMTTHMASEEEVVFPLIVEIEHFRKEGLEIPQETRSEFEKQVKQMEAEHDGAGSLMKKIRALSNDFTPPVDACTKYSILYQNLEGFEKDLHKHVHLENNILFKKAEALVG